MSNNRPNNNLSKLAQAHEADDIIFFRNRNPTYTSLMQAIALPDESLCINVPKKSSAGISRDTYAHTLHELMRSRPLVLVGDECIGKTELAVDYINKFKMRSQDCIWISANGQPWLTQQFYEIIRHWQWRKWVSVNPVELQPVSSTSTITQASGSNTLSAAELPAYVYRHLSLRGSFILVIDDAVPYKLLDFLPSIAQQYHCRILITSRLPASDWRGFDCVTVQELLKTEQPKMFIESKDLSLRPSTVSTLTGDNETICTTLAGHPLLLAMATSYIKCFPERKSTFAQVLKSAHETKQDVAVVCCETILSAVASNENAAKLLSLCSLIAPNHIPEFLLETVIPDATDRSNAIKFLQSLSLLREESKEEVKETKETKAFYAMPRTMQTATIFQTNVEQKLIQNCLWAVNTLQDCLADTKLSDEKRISLIAHGYCLLALSINLKVIKLTELTGLAKELTKLATLIGDSSMIEAVNSLTDTGQPIRLGMPNKFEWDSPYFSAASSIFPSNFSVTVFDRLFIQPMMSEKLAKENVARNKPRAGNDSKDVKDVKEVKVPERKKPLTLGDVDDKIESFFISDYCPLPVSPFAFQLFVDLIRAWLAGQFCALVADQKETEIKRRKDEFNKEFIQSSLHHSFSATSHAHAYLIRVIGKIASYFTTYWRRDSEFADGALQLLDYMHAFGAAGQRMFQAFAKHELGDKAVVFRFERLYGPVEFVVYPRLQTSNNPQPVIQPNQVATPSSTSEKKEEVKKEETIKSETLAQTYIETKQKNEQQLKDMQELKASIKIGSHIGQRKDDWVFKEEWRQKAGAIFGGSRQNQEFLNWIQKEGQQDWFNLEDSKKQDDFLAELSTSKEIKSILLANTSTSLDLHAIFEFEDVRQPLNCFLKNVTLASNALWHTHLDKKAKAGEIKDSKETKNTATQTVNAEEFVNIALQFLQSKTYMNRELNYTRRLRIHHLYHLFDLITNFGKEMNKTQFAIAIGYFMTPNTIDTFPTQTPDDMAEAIETIFPAIVRLNEKLVQEDRHWNPDAVNSDAPSQSGLFSSKNAEIKELKTSDSKDVKATSSSQETKQQQPVKSRVKLTFAGAMARSTTEEKLQNRDERYIVRLNSPRIKMIAGRLSGGLNIVTSGPTYLNSAYNHMSKVAKVPILNYRLPTQFLTLCCNQSPSLDFLPQDLDWLDTYARKEKTAGLAFGNAAPPEARYYRRPAVGEPHFINQYAELMREHLDKLAPPIELKALTSPPPPITAIEGKRSV